MNKFSFIIALISTIPHIAQCEGILAGNATWNSTGKALTESEIDDKYKFGSVKDTGGAFSTFRIGTVKSTGEKVVMKLEDPNKKKCYLPQEVHVYEDVAKRASNLSSSLLDKGFPNLYDYGLYKGKRALIISKLGMDMIDYINSVNKYYGWGGLRPVAKSAIDLVQFLHDTGYIHQDLKPENIMYGEADPKKVKQTGKGRESLANRIYLIDFGSAFKYRDINGTCYKQSKADATSVVTEAFRPRTCRHNLSGGRREDMESLGYILLYIVGVHLPWDDDDDEDEYVPKKSKEEKLAEQNRLCDDLDVAKICIESSVVDIRLHATFLAYFTLLKRLFTAKDGFCQDPDYEAFKKCFDNDPAGYYRTLTDEKLGESKAKKPRNVQGKKTGDDKPSDKLSPESSKASTKSTKSSTKNTKTSTKSVKVSSKK